MSATACTQPGCTGSILDGYCDVCGSPGPASASAGSAAGASSVGGAAGRCAQPGCTGTVVDGYCDVCGSPGAQGAAPISGASVATMPAGAGAVALDRLAGVEPARLDGPGLGPRECRAAARSPGGSAPRRPGCAGPGSAPA